MRMVYCGYGWGYSTTLAADGDTQIKVHHVYSKCGGGTNGTDPVSERTKWSDFSSILQAAATMLLHPHPHHRRLLPWWGGWQSLVFLLCLINIFVGPQRILSPSK